MLLCMIQLSSHFPTAPINFQTPPVISRPWNQVMSLVTDNNMLTTHWVMLKTCIWTSLRATHATVDVKTVWHLSTYLRYNMCYHIWYVSPLHIEFRNLINSCMLELNMVVNWYNILNRIKCTKYGQIYNFTLFSN